MSLYTLTRTAELPFLEQPAGLTIRRSTDIEVLSNLGDISREEVISRLANGHQAFVAFILHQPAAFGWMATSKATIGELNHSFVLPPGSRYLWNFRTLADFRGLGIYPALLQYIIRYEGPTANRFWIIHAPENRSSLKGISKAGFRYVGTLYTNAGGTATLEAGKEGGIYRSILEDMDIQLSSEKAVSCWNCSSPYLKKRKAECCCTAADMECIRNSTLSMAS